MQLTDNRAQTDLVGVMDVVVAEDEGDVGSGIRLPGRVDADDRSGVSFINYFSLALTIRKIARALVTDKFFQPILPIPDLDLNSSYFKTRVTRLGEF
jgi:hypothetical protein